MKNIERIAQLIDNQSISIRAFEISIGASNGAFGRAIRNRTDISSEWLSIIIEIYPDLSAEWLLTGGGEMLKNNETPARQNTKNEERIDKLLDIIASQQKTIEVMAKKVVAADVPGAARMVAKG